MRARAAALAAALAAAGLPAAPAVAHTGLSATRPAEGAVLAAAPAQVTATYSEPLAGVVRAEARVDGRDAAGAAPRLSPADARRVVIPLRAGAGPGRYEVSWVASGADGHELAGSLSFRVRAHPVTAEVRAVARAVAEVAGLLRASLPA